MDHEATCPYMLCYASYAWLSSRFDFFFFFLIKILSSGKLDFFLFGLVQLHTCIFSHRKYGGV